MTGSTATKSESVSVFGVGIEVRRIAAPAAFMPDSSPGSPTIVFLHEGLGSVAMWRDFPDLLCSATGLPGLVYSRRGYGKSDAVFDVRGEGCLKPDYMHHEALQVLPELLRSEGIARPVLFGHSDGGTIALLHAANFDVAACIVMAPHLFVEDISLAAIEQARKAFVQGELRQRLAKFHADVDTAFWQWNDIWLSPAFRSFNIESDCRQITCPLLAIQGHDDPYGTMAQIDALMHVEQDFLSKKGTSGRSSLRRSLLKLEQCGHSPHRDQTQKVIQVCVDFLSH